jgi:hypothetical protein
MVHYCTIRSNRCTLRTDRLYVMVHENDSTHTLDERQEKYLNWLLTPKGDRLPASQAQYCRENNVDPTTVRRWEKKDVFRREWQKRVDDLQGSPERTQQLLDALYTKALDGDTRAANLYLQATHRLTPPPSAETTAARSMAELSNDELDQLILDAAKKERELRNLKIV